MLMTKTTKAIANTKFSVLLSSILLLSVGNKVYEIVLPLLVYELTKSSVSMMAMRTAELLPNFFFAILIGVVVDRVNQKHWALWMVGMQAVLLIFIAYLFKSGITLLFLYNIIGFLLMTFNYGFFNVQVSLTKHVVPPTKLTQANAKISFVETIVTVMGPALSSLLFLMSDTSDGLVLTGCIYMLSLVLLTRLPKAAESRRGSGSTSFLHDLREGWQSFTGNRTLLQISVFVMFINCSFTVVQTSMIFYGKDVLQLSSSMLALIMSAAGVGGLLGSVFVSSLRKRVGLGKIYGVSVMLHSVSCCLLTISSSLTAFVIALLLIGVAVSFHGVSVYTLRHEQTPSNVIGRMAGITGTVFRIGMPIAMYGSGWVIAIWGTAIIFAGSALWNLFFLVLFIRSRLWNIQ